MPHARLNRARRLLRQAARTLHVAAYGRYVIGPGGLEEPGEIHIQPNTIYFLGASSSPDMVIVTKVTDDTIYYRRYPYERDRPIERWIGEDLIEKGSRTWLKSGYPKYNPLLARSLKQMLLGQPGRTVDPEDYKPIIVRMDLADDVPDPYGFTKSWGVLVGTPDDMESPFGWKVQTDRNTLRKIKRHRWVRKAVEEGPAPIHKEDNPWR